MTSERWQEIKTILADALACESDADRLQFVAVSCRDDASLKAEIDSLLANQDSMWCNENFLAGLRTMLGVSAPESQHETWKSAAGGNSLK